MRAKDALGRYGERVAVRHLRDAGWEVLDTNWRCADGELDVVARDGDCLVVVEVKTRRGTAFGTPAEAVTPPKLRRLRRLTALWITAHDVHAPEVRLDVVAVRVPWRGRASVEHLVAVG